MVTATRAAPDRQEPDAIFRRPWLYRKQERAIFDPARFSVIEASTKSGKTVGCLVWIVEQALGGRPGYNYWWVAPVYGQSKIAYRRLKRGIPTDLYTSNEGELTITLRNGAVIWFKSAEKPDSLYGEDVYAVVVEEASRMREESWFAIRTTITATRAPARIIGNVKGKRNWFWRMARRAEAGQRGYGYHRITAYDAISAGVLAQEEVEGAKEDLPEAVYRELYEAIASDDEGNPFGMSYIRGCLRELSPYPAIYYGVDLAKSTDYTVIIGLDDYHHVSYFERFQQPWTETIFAIRKAVGRSWCLVDSTGAGDPVLEALQRPLLESPLIADMIEEEKAMLAASSGDGSNFGGYVFSSPSKQRLMEGLAVTIQGYGVGFPPGPIQMELESYEYVYTRTGVRYSAPEGMHDDCVCSLALAVALAKASSDAAATPEVVIYSPFEQISPY